MEKRILLIHGPNLNMLGIREPEIYGRTTMEQINQEMIELGKRLGAEVECYQSNSEGALIDKIQSAYGAKDGIIINPGAYTHYSYAIHDAIKAVALPAVEVHLSDIQSREEFRRISVIRPACCDQVAGLGKDSYLVALEKLITDYVS
ncbi:MAG: type II 3-dehydroquinate dehydratase [Clostridia bacterium]|nr:type II 3-dehydroquinate dehydratase [Clostridia bacterium]